MRLGKINKLEGFRTVTREYLPILFPGEYDSVLNHQLEDQPNQSRTVILVGGNHLLLTIVFCRWARCFYTGIAYRARLLSFQSCPQLYQVTPPGLLNATPPLFFLNSTIIQRPSSIIWLQVATSVGCDKSGISGGLVAPPPLHPVHFRAR
jgi:hypothetical protein